jgi:hypothetical protein
MTFGIACAKSDDLRRGRPHQREKNAYGELEFLRVLHATLPNNSHNHEDSISKRQTSAIKWPRTGLSPYGRSLARPTRRWYSLVDCTAQNPRKNTGVLILESPLLANNPDKTGIYRMYALNSKVLVLVVCALAVAIVMHSLVYLSIDPASLSAEMPPR